MTRNQAPYQSLGPPKRPVPKTPTETWVPVEGKPHMYRDANSHPDPAYQRRKYEPPPPAFEWIPPGFV